MMEQIFNQFMHIYFWLYTIGLSVNLIDVYANHEELKKITFREKYLKRGQPMLWAIVGLTLWIMSFKY